jgi:hypothetical protein
MMVSFSAVAYVNVGRDLWDRVVLKDIMWRYFRGEMLKPEEFPKAFYHDYYDVKLKKLPDFFQADGFFCFSNRGMKVFKDFDLGEGGFVPVKIYQYDRTTPIEGDYFCLNFGERKPACVIRKSKNVNRTEGGPFPFKVRADSEDYDIAVSKAAFVGADLWTDSNLGYAVFLSDRLVRVLSYHGLAEKLDLKRCLLVDENTND